MYDTEEKIIKIAQDLYYQWKAEHELEFVPEEHTLYLGDKPTTIVQFCNHSKEKEIGRSCNTCNNNDDEFSGECYECVKNIQNHYEEEEIWCTECPYFKYVADDDNSWYGAKCHKDGHEANPSMYAVQSLHDDCPLKRKEGSE